MEPVTEESFIEWKSHPVTLKLFHLLKAEREEMKEGLANKTYEFPDIVIGRCQAVALILDTDYEDLYVNPRK
tara:strand:+ start:587 stop:802 length:216 start_codon:yes stop_codon:yes gene_type:complete